MSSARLWNTKRYRGYSDDALVELDERLEIASGDEAVCEHGSTGDALRHGVRMWMAETLA